MRFTIAEGNWRYHTLELTFTWIRLHPNRAAFLSTSDGTAKAGQDFTASSNQTLTFQPGETQKKINVSMLQMI